MARYLVISGLALVLIGCSHGSNWESKSSGPANCDSNGARFGSYASPPSCYCAEWSGEKRGPLDWGAGPQRICVDDECETIWPRCLRWEPHETVQPPHHSADAERIVDETIRRGIREEESHNAIYRVIQQSSDGDKIFEQAIRKEIQEIESQNAILEGIRGSIDEDP